MKNFIFLIPLLLLCACNVYELTGEELESVITKYPRIEVSPDSFKISDLGPMEKQRVTLRVYNAKFITAGIPSLSLNTPQSAATYTILSTGDTQVVMDIELTSGATQPGRIDLDLTDADFSSTTEFSSSNLRTSIDIK